MDFTDSRHTYRIGHIALQQQHAGSEVRFRRIDIKTLPPSSDIAAVMHLDIGQLLAKKTDRNGAIAAFREATRLDRKNAKAYFLLGKELKLQGDREAALTALRTATKLAPRDAEVFWHLGDVLRAKNQHDDALATYRQAVALDPKDQARLLILAGFLANEDHLVEAIALARKAVQLEGKAPKGLAWERLGELLERQGDYDGAIDCYKKMKAAAKGNRALFGLCRAYQAKGDHAAAIDACHNWIKEFPEDKFQLTSAKRVLAELHLDMGNRKEALEILREMLQTGKGEEAWILTRRLALQGYHEEAIDIYRALLIDFPTQARGYGYLTSILREKGDLKSAMAACSRAIELEPQDPWSVIPFAWRRSSP